jgi:hypothetical protein
MVDFGAEEDVMLTDVYDTFGVTITLTRSNRGTINWTTGAQSSSTSTQNVPALRRPTSKLTFGAGTSGRSERYEETVYDVRVSAVTGTITADALDQWLVTDGAKALEIQQVELSIDQKNYILTCRGSRG